MLFNSAEFIVFFPIVTFLFFLIPHNYRWLHLLIASCVFYAVFVPSYIFILFLLITVDFFAGILIEQSEKNKKTWLIVSIVANIGLLSLFKYTDFIIGNINSVTYSHIPFLKWLLPLGLSFHTFQSLSYTIEVYRGHQRAVKHFGYYALYVMFYPQLVMGPIERPGHLLPQLFTHQKFSAKNLYEGLRLMAWGFFKKTVIADRIGAYADTVFQNPETMNAGNMWLGIFFFTIQMYADFSGYSDIAIGAAKCMGYDLVINFNRPYFSTNIREFWRKWHISLSSWLRDYLYIPLGGNRKSPFRNRFNLLFTFALCGLWHGASWTLIVWGLLQGVYLLLYELINKLMGKTSVNKILGCIITIGCFAFSLIFVRAASMHNAFAVIKQSFAGPFPLDIKSITSLPTQRIQYGNFMMVLNFLFITFMFITEKYTSPTLVNLNNKKYIDTGFTSFIILLTLFFGVFQKVNFIYFQF